MVNWSELDGLDLPDDGIDSVAARLELSLQSNARDLLANFGRSPANQLSTVAPALGHERGLVHDGVAGAIQLPQPLGAEQERKEMMLHRGCFGVAPLVVRTNVITANVTPVRGMSRAEICSAAGKASAAKRRAKSNPREPHSSNLGIAIHQPSACHALVPFPVPQAIGQVDGKHSLTPAGLDGLKWMTRKR